MSKAEDPKTTSPAAATALRDDPAIDPADLGGVASLDKVRDILFGVQLREFERRFTRLEERFVKEITDLRDEVNRRVDALAQLTASLNEQISTNHREFRQHQGDIRKRMTEDVRQQVDHVLLGLARELQELRTEKADRAALASLFTEMAKLLTAKPPAGEDAGGG